ncbi:putative non-specific serine/threonine protein kinase [Helianthus debilis subsp. tardiflorus]
MSGGVTQVANEAIFIDSSGPNNPPSGILKNAVTVESTSNSLLLAIVRPTNTPVYAAMYFSEVRNLDSTQTRSFSIYETSTAGSDPIQQPIEPPYGSVVVRELNDYTVDSITNISLFATLGSDLPPLINALEAFNISQVLTDGTDSNDVEALALLQKTFDVLGEWSGDPCLPAPYSWDWLSCSDDDTPRVTAFDLHNNSLTGPIPDYLGTMSYLKQL